MSGFVAVVNTAGAPVDHALLERLTGAMAFRGPDAQRTWADGSVGLGHTLLATVDDYPEVPQPCSLDGRVWLAGDVRVDGRSELVAKLKDRVRASLATASDPELVLHAYQAWGERCVEHLIGDFAFAVWDGARRQLFCGRDHMGVKPLFYAHTQDTLIVSNTIDPIRAHPTVSHELNEGTIGDFLLFGYVVDPATTAFAHIQRLPAAHRLTWTGGMLRAARYWTLPIEPPIQYRREADYADGFSELLHAAIADRLRTGRVTVQMSGGLDSSSVAAIARRLRPDADLCAYTTVFDELIPDDERHFAGRVADHLKIPIQYTVADGYELYARPSGLRLRSPAPVHEPGWAGIMTEYAEISGTSRVALTGQGGDAGFLPWAGEILGDIRRMHLAGAIGTLRSYVRTQRRLPRLGIRTALARRYSCQTAVPACPPWLRGDFAARIGAEHRIRREAARRLPVHPHRVTAYESLTHPYWDFLLTGCDAGVTGSALEVRHPLLDIRLLRFLLTLPSFPYCADKHLFRVVMRGILPDDVVRRPKTPLRQSPLLARVARGRAAGLRELEDPVALSRFVRMDRIPTFCELAEDVSAVDEGLRPHSLDAWLTAVGELCPSSALDVVPAPLPARSPSTRGTCYDQHDRACQEEVRVAQPLGARQRA